MDWTELSVATNSAGADLVSEALMRAGAAGTQIIDRADVPPPGKPGALWELVDPSLAESLPRNVVVKAWFATPQSARAARGELDALRRRAGGAAGSLTLSLGSAREEDWAECWKTYFKPFRLGRRLVVKPSWEPWGAREEDLVIEIDPGMAFGTGTHETTALCLQLIEKHWQPGTALDIGTGSGILAIAAARLGSQRVLAIDLDPVAVRVAAENVRLNGLRLVVEVRQGDLCQGLEERFALAAANIIADAVILLAAPLREHLAEGAVFICSGVIRDREEEVREALARAGYLVLDAMRQGEWVALAARPCAGGPESGPEGA